MCQFFSFVTKGSKKYYFNWDQRQELLKSNPKYYSPDSHTSICDYHNLNDDKVNKYEYNPLTKKFITDQINIKDNQALAKKWVESLDFKTIVKPLVLKTIKHPFRDFDKVDVGSEQIQLLKEWASVRASVRASVWASVGASVWASVWASVRSSVGESVWDSVRAYVGESVGDSVKAYTSSFIVLEKWEYIEHKKGVNPFQSCIDLWDQGLVPSFDGKIWRLHSGEKADIVYEISAEKLKNL